MPTLHSLRRSIARTLQAVLPGRIYSRLRLARALVATLARETVAFGPQAAVALMLAEVSLRVRGPQPAGSASLLRVRLRGVRHPIFIRWNTSDHFVLRQMFAEEQYKECRAVEPGGVVIDCGANVGCSAVYFLNRWPTARVIAIEPDGGNAALCRKNLARYGNRAVTVEAALWSCDTQLRVARGTYRDGLDWSHQTLPCSEGESGDVRAVTMPSLIARFGLDRVALVKIDIEGAEEQVFNTDCDSWLARTDNLAIELHGPACEAALFNALSRFRFHLVRHEEITYCLDIKPDERPGAAADPPLG